MGEGPAGSERDGELTASSASVDERQRPADARETFADERERVLDAREVRADARDGLQEDRKDLEHGILADAEQRDDEAEAGDFAANRRDIAASLESFLHDDEYGAALKARRSSAMDRPDSQTDRTSAANDRSKLTGDDPTPRKTEEDQGP